MLVVAKQTLQVKSLEELTEIIKLAFDNIDTNLSLSYILSYLTLAIEFNPDTLVLEQLPGQSVYENGVWLFKHDENKTQTLFESLKFN